MNLEEAARERRVAALRVEYGRPGRMPVPWAVRGSVAALRQAASGRFAATLFHTSTIALLAPLASLRRRYVLSLDATPLQVDGMGRWYRHAQGSRLAEAAKRAAYSRLFRGAAGVVSWSRWALDSVERDYGVHPRQALIAHPGASRDFFAIPRAARAPGPVRVLFVGGDFERKGGPLLLNALRPLAGRVETTLVTEAPVQPQPGLRVLRGVQPGTTALLDAYREADIFCLPTLGDCTPVVLGEAMAAGLPVVTTTVGSNSETVRHGETGFLLDPGDGAGLAAALRALIDDGALRERFSRSARDYAHDRMDALANARRVLDFLAEAA